MVPIKGTANDVGILQFFDEKEKEAENQFLILLKPRKSPIA